MNLLEASPVLNDTEAASPHSMKFDGLDRKHSDSRALGCMQVLVLRLMTENSVEEHVLKAARAKQSLADQSITGKLKICVPCGTFSSNIQGFQRRSVL